MDDEDAFGDGAHAALEHFPVNLERLGVLGIPGGMSVLHGPPVTLDDRLQIQVIEPDGLGGEAYGHQQQAEEGPRTESHVVILR